MDVMEIGNIQELFFRALLLCNLKSAQRLLCFVWHHTIHLHWPCLNRVSHLSTMTHSFLHWLQISHYTICKKLSTVKIPSNASRQFFCLLILKFPCEVVLLLSSLCLLHLCPHHIHLRLFIFLLNLPSLCS